ncbi:hypothetical protein BH09MYX1_BH09MYX1_04050 [soil metagenome]
MAGPTDPFALVGQLLDGQFRVDAMIGEGGFSVVYRGHHMALDEPIAIKCLKLNGNLASALVESFVTRFRDESRILYRLSQGNLSIVRSIASGTVVVQPSNAMVPFMVLEWLEGTSLATDLDARRDAGKTGRSIGEVLELLDSAADALAYAHAQGVVHRDLNPGNLFLALSRDGTSRTKVLDFGLAKVVSDHAIELGPRAPTFAQIRVFSPAYAAPEQFDTDLGVAGARSDVYSFAILATEALLDRPVVEGTALGEFMTKTLDPKFVRTPGALGAKVGSAVEAVFKRALSISPADRFADVETFWSALEEAASIDGADDPAAARKTMRMVRPITDGVPAAAPAAQASTPAVQQLKALKSTVRMPTGSAPTSGGAASSGSQPAAAPEPTSASALLGAPAIVRPATSVGSNPDPSQPLVLVAKDPDPPKPLDPARHRSTVLTGRRPDDPASPVGTALRATVAARHLAPEPVAKASGRVRLLIGLLFFFAVLSVGTAALFVAQRFGH